MSHDVTVVGGGLAGCEAALRLAGAGRRVRLLEMRPVRGTEAHQTDRLGELVCTNSFKSEAVWNAHGQLKREMRTLGSVLLRSADASRVAAGSALAVDRHLFAEAMTAAVQSHPRVEVVREECTALPDGPTVIATGPLTSGALYDVIEAALGDGGLAFFDAIAPIVDRESVDDGIVFAQGRSPVRGSVSPMGFMGPKRRVSSPREAMTSMGRHPSKYGTASNSCPRWTSAAFSAAMNPSYSSLDMGQFR